MRHAEDLTGAVLPSSLLTPLRRGPNQGSHTTWICRCQCGTPETRPIKTVHLRSGKIRSCGCLRRAETGKRATRHGLSESKCYRTWRNARQRVGVCARWANFTHFIEDLGENPGEVASLVKALPSDIYRCGVASCDDCGAAKPPLKRNGQWRPTTVEAPSGGPPLAGDVPARSARPTEGR
jgi:hypothetical protein